jgi:hypothetical protein
MKFTNTRGVNLGKSYSVKYYMTFKCMECLLVTIDQEACVCVYVCVCVCVCVCVSKCRTITRFQCVITNPIDHTSRSQFCSFLAFEKLRDLMEPKGALKHSQQPATVSCSFPHELSPTPDMKKN